MEKGLALLGKIHDGDVGSFTGPQLIQLAGHFPAGFTHFEEHMTTLKYSDHQRILQGKEVPDVTYLATSDTDCSGDCTIATIDPPPAADGDGATLRVKNNLRYYRFSEVRQQVALTMRAVGRKALSIHRTIRGTAIHRADA